MRLLLSIAALFLVSGVATAKPLRGAPVSIESVQQFQRAAIDEDNGHLELSGPAMCDVRVVQLTYRSIGVRGEPEVLSAGMYVPENCAGPFPLLAEAHGTQADRTRLTTDVGPGSYAITFFAARGYVVVSADYLGLGKSTYPFHPYLHADSEASAIIDAIRAARVAARQLDVPLTDAVMLYGYSQGGHAAMAAQREIERKHADEIKLTASSPMAGPYHLSQVFLGSWFGYTAGEPNALASELFAYTAISYNRVYGTLYRRPEELFASRYAGDIEALFSGKLGISEMHEQNKLPGSRLDELRNPAFTAAFLVDENQPLRVALRKNDLLDWTPRTPTLLCGSRRDAIVDFHSARAARAAFRAKGAEVAIVDIADDIPASADGTAHHMQYEYLCLAKARAELFEPLLRKQPLRLSERTSY